MTKLRECPFCGSGGESVYLTGQGTGWLYTICDVLKGGCGATSGRYEDEQEAITAWNTRHDGWVSVDNRPPEEKGGILVYEPHYKPEVYEYDYDGEWLDKSITHWQPLPPKPRREGE